MKIVFTEDQLTELKQLMDSGVRQTDIAKHFGVTDDTIRRICRENDLTVRMPYQCQCIICGDTFYSNVKGARTCKKEHHRSCAVCGKDFIVDRSNIRDTCSYECSSLLKYGTKHPKQSAEIKEKCVNSLLSKYGVTNVSQLPDHKLKSEQTCLEKYGSTSYAGSSTGRKKTQQTNLDRYGCAELLSDLDFRQRIDQINIERYGTAHPMQTLEVQSKQQSTLQSRYGVDNPMKSDIIKERFRINCKSKYNVDWPSKSNQVKQAWSDTCLERFGVPWACLRPEAQNKGCRSKINIQFEEMLNSHGLVTSHEFVLGDKSFDIKVGQTLIELDPTITHNSYMSIFPSVDPKTSTYHFNKTQLALDHDYRCIHVFDWDNWDKICSLVTLPVNAVYARNKEISVRSVSESIAISFTSEYHIQGSCRGQSCNYGLYFDDELIELMTFGTPRYNTKYDKELLRLCTKSGWRIIGGASKLFCRFIEDNPGQSVISYCDAAKFTGDVYYKIGMKLATLTQPAKIWSKDSKYVTDNLLRQRGYDQLFGTNYGKGTSNEQLMLDNGWLPVYDCGQKVFEYVP